MNGTTTSSTGLDELRAIIANDGYAMTFQSFGQYRTALLREINVLSLRDGLNNSARHIAAEVASLTPLNEDTQDILGRPNFTCISIAHRLRQLGHDIENRAENEQAAVVHFLLNMYERHGAEWREHANAYLRTNPATPASKPEGGAA